MPNCKRLFTVLFCFLVSVNVLAAKPIVLTLKDAVYLALRNNANVQQQEIQRISDKFAVLLAEWNFQPQYTLTGSYEVDQTKSDGSIPTTTRTWAGSPKVTLNNHYGTTFTASMTNGITNGQYNPSFQFQIEQALIKGFGRPIVDATLNNAIDTERQNKLNFKKLALTTIQNTISAYFALVQAYQALGVSYQSLQQNEITVQNDKLLIQAGRMAGADIVQAQAQVAQAKASIAQNLNEITSAKTALLDVLGLSESANIVIPHSFSFNKTVNLITGNKKLPSLSKGIRLALNNNIDYQVNKIGIFILRRNVMVNLNNNEPTLDLTAQTTRGGGTEGGQNAGFESILNGSSYNNSVELQLSVPINDMNNKQAIINAKVALDQAQIALQEEKRQLTESVRTNFENLKTSYQQLLLNRQALALQRKNYQMNNEKFIAGKISNFELLTLQQDLTSAENTVINSQIDYLNAIVTIETQLGTTLEPWHVKVRY